MKFIDALLLLIVVSLTACAPQAVHFGAANSSLPQLVVSGDGSIKVAPDQLQMRLGVVTQQPLADEALTENNRRMAEVMAQLQDVGIGSDEMSTGQFQVRPEWNLPPRPTPANWQRQIVAYRVSNELLIATSRVELAGKLLGLAQQAGANQIGGLQFTLTNPEASKQLAISQATAKAIRQAETLAAAAGVKLGMVQSISLDASAGAPQPRLMMAEARMASVDSVPVAAGQVEVSAAVTIVYRLEDGAQQ